MTVGIVGWGAYVPKFRIKAEEIAKVWGQDVDSIKKGLNIHEKAVPGLDEDSITIAVESARNALLRAEIDPNKVNALFYGSESHPYAVKPTGTIVAEVIGCQPNYTTADLEFACKAGTVAVQIIMGLVKSGIVEYGIAGGVDTAQGAPGDPLEYSAAAGGATFIIGSKDVVAEINETDSYTTDTPDFWRRDHQNYPNHGGAFTGKPAYFDKITNATRNLMKKAGTKPSDYNYAIFHQPNGKFPVRVAKSLGFSSEQTKYGFLAPRIGNTYSASVMLGLSATLDVAKPGDRILLTSYGSGAGSDSFDITVTSKINEIRNKARFVEDYISEKKYITYSHYAKYRKKYKLR